MKPTSISGFWDIYAVAINKGVGPKEITARRDAFFGGAVCVMDIVRRLPEMEDGSKIFDAIQREISNYAADRLIRELFDTEPSDALREIVLSASREQCKANWKEMSKEAERRRRAAEPGTH